MQISRQELSDLGILDEALDAIGYDYHSFIERSYEDTEITLTIDQFKQLLNTY